MKNHEINIDLRGKFVRIFNYLYIDDPPHKLMKMTRAFKAYESSNVLIQQISSTRADYLSDHDLDDLIYFIKEHIKAFGKEATGISYIKSFHMEFVRMINYLIRFGLFIYRKNTFQSQDMDLIFSFLCFI